MRTNNNVSMTWVPWSGHGMTEFFTKNSVYIYVAKLLFILAFVFLGELVYNRGALGKTVLGIETH